VLAPVAAGELTDRRGCFDAATIQKIKDAIHFAFDLQTRTPKLAGE
jgi:hypothetical protein